MSLLPWSPVNHAVNTLRLLLCRVGGRLKEHLWPKDGYGRRWIWGIHAFGSNRTLEETTVEAAMGLKDSASILGYNATEIFGITATNATRAWGTMTSDVFYVPERLRIDFIALSMHFTALHLHTEVVTAYLMAMLSRGNHHNYFQLDGSWLWGEQRNNVSAWGLSRNGLTGDRFWVHAVKLSKHAHTVTRWWSDLSCS
jgi:hypothetical protein